MFKLLVEILEELDRRARYDSRELPDRRFRNCGAGAVRARDGVAPIDFVVNSWHRD